MERPTKVPPASLMADAPQPSRRTVLRGIASTALLAGLGAPALADDDAPVSAPMPTRAFGKTGRKVSAFGLGCFPLGSLASEREAVDVVLAALEAGCTYLDTAPTYRRGASEQRVGHALKAWGRRDTLTLASKTTERSADGARRDLEGTLERLGVPCLDLIQVHAIKDADDLERALDPKSGPLAALVAAKEQGLVKHIGVTGHADPEVMANAIRQHPFESLLIPLNCVDPHRLSFVKTTLPVAVEKGIARVGMKVFASGELVKRGIEAEHCLRYAYGLDVSTTIVGCSSVEEVALAARVAREAKPLDAEATAALLGRTAAHQGKPVEWYKRS
ncbi:MAG: aldo/keto reductase [Planctomycetota bacterium]